MSHWTSLAPPIEGRELAQNWNAAYVAAMWGPRISPNLLERHATPARRQTLEATLAEAYHVAGHAVVAVLRGRPALDVALTHLRRPCRPPASAHLPKGFRAHGCGESPDMIAILNDHIDVAFGGPAAEELFVRTDTLAGRTCSADVDCALEAAGSIHGDTNVIDAHLTYRYVFVRNELSCSLIFPALRAVAEALAEHRHLSADQVATLIDTARGDFAGPRMTVQYRHIRDGRWSYHAATDVEATARAAHKMAAVQAERANAARAHEVPVHA